MGFLNLVTEATCGEACWQAREDICRCSCGGKNHGCLRGVDGARPMRTAKLDGIMYELKAVGPCRELSQQAEPINKSAGFIFYPNLPQLNNKYYWKDSDPGAPARIKPASKTQIECWPELTSYKSLDKFDLYHNKPYLLWVRLQPVKP